MENLRNPRVLGTQYRVYDKDGKANNKVLVITLVNSKNIITMAPTYSNKVRLKNKNKDKKYNR